MGENGDPEGVPVDPNELKDVGTYVYFDYETGWTNRVKDNFEFDLQFLENELIIPETMRAPSIFGEGSSLFSASWMLLLGGARRLHLCLITN